MRLCRPAPGSNASIETRRNLHGDKWKRGPHEFREAVVELARLGLEHSGLNLNAGGKQSLNAGAVDQGIRVAGGNDNPPHTRRQQRLGTRSGSSLMVARLEGDVSSRAPRQIPRLLQGADLRMIAFVVFMEALAGQAAALHEDAADGGVGRGDADGPAG